MTDHPQLDKELIRAQMWRIQALEMVIEDLKTFAKYPNVGTVVIARTDWDLCMKRAERKPHTNDR